MVEHSPKIVASEEKATLNFYGRNDRAALCGLFERVYCTQIRLFDVV